MLELTEVEKSIDGRAIVAKTSLSVESGQTVALIGPSGSGKSTLLAMAVGLVWPDRGAVSIDGEALTPANAERLRRRVGYVIQEGGLFPHMTARENVTLVSRLTGVSPERIDARVAELRELVRLPEAALARHPHELSGGERQRVGLMRALALDPPVLLLDEPLGALDPLVRAALQTDLRDIIRALGKCVLFVTHDMAEAAYFGDEIALLRDGQIVQRGTIRALLDAPADAFVRDFVRAQRDLAGSLS